MIDAKLLKKLLDDPPIVEEKQKRPYIPPELKEEVRKRDNHKCRVCNREKNLKVHHIIPYGESSLENLITLCEFCHEYIHKILKRKGYPFFSPAMRMKMQGQNPYSFR